MKTIISDYLKNVNDSITKLDENEFLKIIELLKHARKNKKNIFIFGNGGSAATASHFVCDINKGANNNFEPRFKVICLNDNIPTLTAYGNDMGYEFVFKEQLENFLNKEDVVIAISGSGNSKNIINAIEYANEKQAVVIGITGFDGGKLKKLSNYSLNANINDMQISEDIHMIWVHVMLKCLIS